MMSLFAGVSGSNLCNCLDESFTRGRFRKVYRETGAVASPYVIFLAVAAQRNPGQDAASGTKLLHQLIAGAVRKRQIAQKQIEALPFGCVQRIAHRSATTTSCPAAINTWRIIFAVTP